MVICELLCGFSLYLFRLLCSNKSNNGYEIISLGDFMKIQTPSDVHFGFGEVALDNLPVDIYI